MTGPDTVHRGAWTMEDRAEDVLRSLPVDVPPGTAALDVTLAYAGEGGGVLDLGLLGPEGEFRGWSGGARDRFTVTEKWATPGYLPGPLAPGTWQVLLRLHRVPPEGVPYEARARTSVRTPDEPSRAYPPPLPADGRRRLRELPAADGMRWYAGDLHAHTEHSDGALSIDALARHAAAEGLDFLAVTDHNTVSHHPWLAAAGARQGITLLPGQEVTTDLGHANVFGDTGWIDFRTGAGSWLSQAESGGGFLSVNHPLADDCAWELDFGARRPRHAEIWHHTWADRRHGAPLAWARAWRPDVIPLGGSDFHAPHQGRPLGAPTTWVLAEEGQLLSGLSAGRTAISASPDAPLLLRYGDELLAVEAEGTVLVRPDGSRTVIRTDRAWLPAAKGLHRLEAYDCEVIALCP
ncbi:CehA/McbA family metallohydrolase [Streptomyces sp. NPDC048172]|uniref:CehA/McbA family metallohydrolase n=1 Tax=Streptomyces sp. NPDC048172 TaxID=3365505 RepID=UPI00371FEA00